jgi:uncharacterized membrane protein
MAEAHAQSWPKLPLGSHLAVQWSLKIGRWLIYLLAIAVAVISYRYLFETPPIPPSIAANRYRKIWLVTHAGFAATALLVGAVQFSNALRERSPLIHRIVGRVYVMSCLIGASAGLVLACGSSAGPIATAGFGSLAIVWLLTNVVGWQRAVLGQINQHRQWMIRSWALTLSAVTLRLYIPIFEMAGFSEGPAYRAISFLCWVPNLMLAELWLRRPPVRP